MKGWHMYSRIQELKEKGFSIRQAARLAGVSRNTVQKYWEMNPEQFCETHKAVDRMTALMAYEPVVVKWLEAYPCMTAAQVQDWLEERHRLDTAGRTIRRFVAKLREKHGITRKAEPKREYEAVEELPKGQQAQLDFGVKTVRHSDSSRYVKLYFAVFTLSYSRYKWGVFLDRPFLSEDLVSALYGFFEYIGGMPRQLVYDQDSIIVVNENGGDIIHTRAFAAFLSETKLEVRVCRKADPESKGLIEASVKFVKGNFMENRLYMGLDIWNRAFGDWLERTGNGRQHGTTKRTPASMFAEEQEHLLPLFGAKPAKIAEESERNIRPDNTILYRSNRYSVPYGTYSKQKKAYLSVKGDELQIMDDIGEVIASHKISEEKGKLIRPECHRRNRSERINALQEKAVALLGEDFREYISKLCDEKRRYAKEQLGIVISACETYGRESALAAMEHCLRHKLYSAHDLYDAAGALSDKPSAPPPSGRLPVSGERYHIRVQKRELSVYAGVASGKEVTGTS
jgi:transposase